MKRGMTMALAAACLCLAAGAQAQTARVTRGSVNKTVFGAGEIQPASMPGVYADIDAEVLEWYVGLGDTVEAGDVLMKLENDELAAEVAQLEYEIQTAQDDVLRTKDHTQYAYKPLLDDAGDPRYDVNTGEPMMEKYSDEITIRAPSAGRVMAVYIQPGDDALAEYRAHGSVVMLSTDGRMKVELSGIEGVELAYDQTVRVTGEDFETTGNVVALKRRGMEATIQVSSDSYPMDAPVTVTTLEGEVIGEGILAINKPMAVSAYGGTVKGLAWNVQVGKYLERYDVIARIDWDEIPLYYDNDKGLWTYTKKKIELEKAKEKLEALTVVAPCDGRIASIDVEKGDSVEAGTQVMSVVEDGAGMELILHIDELDIPLVCEGQQVTLAVDALEGVTLTGVVQKIAPLGNTESSVTTYDVYVSVTGDVDSRVLGGMNVTGEIQVSAEESALLLPAEAVARDGDGWTVQMQDGTVRRVELGIATDGQVQILSGLSEGDTVVYGDGAQA